MKVTDKLYSMDKSLVGKMDLMVDRCSGKRKMDNLIILDGNEGYGKTTLSIQMAYYMAWKAGRTFGIENVFFDIEKLIEFAKNSQDQVLIWDEAALAGMATEWQNKTQKRLIKLLMIARKKRHIWIFNIPKFFKLNEYLVVDRSIALVHVYAHNENELGLFAYYNKSKKDDFFYEWRKTKKRAYKKFYTLRGRFSDGFKGIVCEEAYDKMKDYAISNMDGGEKLNKKEEKLMRLQYKLAMTKTLTQKQVAEIVGITRQAVAKWALYGEKYPHFLEIEPKSNPQPATYIN